MRRIRRYSYAQFLARRAFRALFRSYGGEFRAGKFKRGGSLRSGGVFGDKFRRTLYGICAGCGLLRYKSKRRYGRNAKYRLRNGR